MERPLGVAVRGLITGEVPDDESVVAGTRKEHVGAVGMVSTDSRCRDQPSLQSYFSIDVAKLVTQPFCTKSLVSRCP